MMASDAGAIDTEAFIAQVEVHRELWDITNENYKNRVKRRENWLEIFHYFCPDRRDLSEVEKTDIERTLLQKWRNIRDAYVKDCKAQKESHYSGVKKRRRYRFSQNLHFLDTMYMSHDAYSSIMDEEPVQGVLYEGDLSTGDDNRALFAADFTSIHHSPPPMQLETPSDLDSDQYFFMSLLPVVRKFNDDQRLEFRAQVIDIVRKIKNSKSLSVGDANWHLSRTASNAQRVGDNNAPCTSSSDVFPDTFPSLESQRYQENRGQSDNLKMEPSEH